MVPCWLWLASECDYDSVQTRSGPRHGVSTSACEAPSVSPHQLSVAPIYSTVGRKIKPPTPTFAEENYLVNSITQRGESWEVTLYSLQCQGRQSLQTNLIYPVIAGLLRALSLVTSCGLPRVKHFKFNYQNVAPLYITHSAFAVNCLNSILGLSLPCYFNLPALRQFHKGIIKPKIVIWSKKQALRYRYMYNCPIWSFSICLTSGGENERRPTDLVTFQSEYF